jgi:hypothetical protein
MRFFKIIPSSFFHPIKKNHSNMDKNRFNVNANWIKHNFLIEHEPKCDLTLHCNETLECVGSAKKEIFVFFKALFLAHLHTVFLSFGQQSEIAPSSRYIKLFSDDLFLTLTIMFLNCNY